MEIQLIRGKWTMNGIEYKYLSEVDKKIFGVLLQVERICLKYNL